MKKHNQTKLIFAASVVMCASGLYAAEVGNCAAISDAGKRLECYDKAPKSAAKTKAGSGGAKAKALAPLEALKRFRARTETGISYNDYVKALGELNYEIREFSDSPEARSIPKITGLLNTAFIRYKTAGTLWEGKNISNPGGDIFHRGDERSAQAKFFDSIVEVYSPKIQPFVKTNNNSTYLVFQPVLSLIWSFASEDIREASELIKK